MKPTYIGYRSGSESSIKFHQLQYKARSIKCRASYIQAYIPGRAVRSATCNLICERRTQTATGARAFGVVAQKSGTTYLTLYNLATLLPHLKRT